MNRSLTYRSTFGAVIVLLIAIYCLVSTATPTRAAPYRLLDRGRRLNNSVLLNQAANNQQPRGSDRAQGLG